jgi:hypothetical protein
MQYTTVGYECAANSSRWTDAAAIPTTYEWATGWSIETGTG